MPDAASEEAVSYEVTLALIKPDVVTSRCVGAVLSRMERDWDIIDLASVQWTPSMVAHWYTGKDGASWWPDFVRFMTSRPMIHVLLGGPDAVESFRLATGPMDPKASTDTIRSHFGSKSGPVMCNAVHASDSPESALRELALTRAWLHDSCSVTASSGWGHAFVSRLDLAPWLRGRFGLTP